MKIVYLHQYFLFPDQSGGTRSYDLAKGFTESGFQVEVVTSSSDERFDTGKRWITIDRENIKVHYIYLPYDNSLSYPRRILAFLKFLIYSSFKLFSIQADLLLATSTPLTIGIPALLKRWIQKTPFIFEVRDVWPEAVIAIGAIQNSIIKRILYWLEGVIYKHAFAIVPLSLDMKTSILSRYPQLLGKPIEVIENLSEINRFQGCEESVDLASIIGLTPKFTVLYAGTFGKVNGIDYVVELAVRTLLLEPQLIYLLMGNGAEKKNIEKLANERGVLNKNLFILAPISKSGLPKWYRSASMGSSFVIDIKELWANSANKFFDTLAAGRPILINHEGWQAQKIREANIGYVLPPVLADSDAESFVMYTRNNQLHKAQGQRALEIATKNYSLKVAVDKYVQIIDRIQVKS